MKQWAAGFMLGISLTLFMLFSSFLGGTNSSWNQFPYTPQYIESLRYKKVPNPTEVARGKVFERLAQIYQEDGGTVIAQSTDALPNATTETGLSVRGYLIQEIVVDPPIYIEATGGYISTPQLCLAQVKTARTFNRLWRISVLGSGFSTNFSAGGLHEPSPVSIWINDIFLGYAWRNALNPKSGPTLLIHNPAHLKEGAIIGIGQGPFHVQDAHLTPTPSIPVAFTKPIHFNKAPMP